MFTYSSAPIPQRLFNWPVTCVVAPTICDHDGPWSCRKIRKCWTRLTWLIPLGSWPHANSGTQPYGFIACARSCAKTLDSYARGIETVHLLTSVPRWQETHRAAKNEGYFDLKRPILCERIKCSHSFVSVLCCGHS